MATEAPCSGATSVHVCTASDVAARLDEDEDCLTHLAIDTKPEDGRLRDYGVDEQENAVTRSRCRYEYERFLEVRTHSLRDS